MSDESFVPKPMSGNLWENALKRARLGVWDWNLLTGQCVYSDTWFEMLGYAPGELTQDSQLWLRISHPDDRDRALASGDRHVAGETNEIETELRLRHKQGHWLWVLDRGGVIERDVNGRPTRVVGVQTDISSLKIAEQALEQINRRYDLVLEASATGIWEFDVASGESRWDDCTRQMFGVPLNPAPLEKNIWHSFLHPDDKERAERAHALDSDVRSPSKVRYRIVRQDGVIRHVETRAVFILDKHSQGSILGTIRDVSEEVRAEEALNTEKEKLRVTLRSISDAVLSTDSTGVITFVNPSAAKLIGRSEDLLLGVDIAQVSIAKTQTPLAKIFEGPTSTETTDISRLDSEDISVRWSSSAINGPGRSKLGFVYTFQDVTQEQKRQKALTHLANHDPLTGLLNRNAFDTELKERIALAHNDLFAVFYIDLDYFKGLNDFAGHAAGDQALIAVATALHEKLPATASIARLGGDEFTIVMPVRQRDETVAAAQLVLETIQNVDLGGPFAHRRLGASVGVAPICDSAISSADALALADDACYVAKSSGRNQYSIVSPVSDSQTSGLTAARIVADIADARGEGRLLLYGQEIRLTKEPWTFCGHVEVLARMITSAGKIIGPGEFIPAAERFGMAAPLDRWIIQRALELHGHAMRDEGVLSLAFNLSAQTLSDPDLWVTIDRTMTDQSVFRSNITFEITETAAFTNFEAAERFVRAARASGCRVSLDDFGTGLSSFEYLRRFPVDTIKIDGSFIQNIATKKFDREVVSAISTIAHNLGYDVVAEKIETPEVIGILEQMGVKFCQGYLMHRPEPLSNIVERVSPSTFRACRISGRII